MHGNEENFPVPTMIIEQPSRQTTCHQSPLTTDAAAGIVHLVNGTITIMTIHHEL